MRGLGRRLRFLAIATVIALAASTVTGDATYRPSVRPVGWTSTGELIFVHQEETGGYDWRRYACGGSGVYVLRRRGPDPLIVGRPWCGRADGVEGDFTLSADGHRLFVAHEYPADHCGTLRTLDLRQGAWSRLFRTCTSDLSAAAVAPDGRAFVARRNCGWRYGGGEPPQVLPSGCVETRDGRLRLFSSDGTGERPIGGKTHEHPVWSPDGRALLVIDTDSQRIVRLDAATGAERAITRGSDPAWSPDGRWIAFIGDDGSGGRSGSALRIVRTDGTGERTIFRFRERRTWNFDTRFNGAPESPLWSPDGRGIVFVRHHNRGQTLWRVNADGTGLRRLTRPMQAAE
ncbi:MAG TPA: hypothetical protein VGX50_03910 [Longimicrobium sp.]|nr:hypothetical protein [Longimicrobium sp.]